VVESFTPDFYLPDHNLYIELTTLKQELVTKKNRKVRQLKRLHPEINVKVIYGKDYKRLLEKFARGMQLERKDDGDKKTAPSDP
jgi:hypoxanthine phosphoribosyltransferase